MVQDKFKEIRTAFRRGVPLFAISAPDRIESVEALTQAILKTERLPFSLDVLQGVSPLSASAKQTWEEGILPELGVKASSFVGPAGTASLLQNWLRKPALFVGSVWIFQGANWFADDPSVVQGLLSLRGTLSKSQASIILLDSTFPRLSGQIARDCYRFSIPLPTPQEVGDIVEKTASAMVQLGPDGNPTPETRQFAEIRQAENFPKIVDSLLGISPFLVEQSVALAATSQGLAPEPLLRKKKDSVQGVQGLTWLDPIPLDMVKGNSQAKEYLSSLLGGTWPYSVVVFADEIDKTLGSSSGDTSGVMQAMHGSTLTYLNDEEVSGCLLYGVPGTGKSLLCQAIASCAGLPCIMLDFSRMKNSLVGKTEENLSRAFEVLSSLAQGKGKILFLATCNRVDGISTELASRLSMGSFFFDFPEEEVKQAIWEVQRVRWGLDEQPFPESHNWVGRDIQKAGEVAGRTGRSLVEAAKFIVPTYTQAGEAISQLRKEASGRFLSSAHPGVFYAESQSAIPFSALGTAAVRAIRL